MGGMGIVWEAYHKGVPLLGVPLLGVPENSTDTRIIPLAIPTALLWPLLILRHGNTTIEENNEKKKLFKRSIWWYQLPSDLYFCIFKNVQCVSIFSAKLLECQRVKPAKRKATWLQHTFLVVLGSNDSVDLVVIMLMNNLLWNQLILWIPPKMYALCGSHPNWWPPVIDLSSPNLYATIAIQASDISSFDHCSSVNNFSATSSVVPTKTILSHKEPQIQRWPGEAMQKKYASCHQ